MEAVRSARGASAVVAATQQDLANAIGSVREVVARAIEELRSDGLIERTKAGIRVLDPHRLEGDALLRRPRRSRRLHRLQRRSQLAD